MTRLFFSIVALVLVASIPAFAQDDDIDAAIKKEMQKTMENANKPASKADMKKLEEGANADIAKADAENKAEEAKQKAAVQAVVNSKDPVSFPAWAPQVPEFKPSGPAVKKLVDGEPKLVQTGTSTLSPDALCDEWDKFKNPKFSHERGGSEMNHNADLYVSYRNSEDNVEVKMEAERKAGGKTTRVTISSPLPVPSPTDAAEGD